MTTRTKIDFGIHITPYFACMARMEDGIPVIVKSESLRDTVPMYMAFNKKGNVFVSDAAYSIFKFDRIREFRNWNSSNSFLEFTWTPGTDQNYYSLNTKKSYNSEELLAEVLKKLRSFITDDNIQSVVITVPAKFDIRQKDATLRAAKLAGFKYTELLQEPIAASLAYGLDSKNKNGYWIVFNFNTSTFDASLVKIDNGVMIVIDTDGNNYLGGKNLDLAIVDEIIIPYLQENYSINSILEDNTKKQILREDLKYYAEEAKIKLSFNEVHNILSDSGDIPGEDDEGEEFELDITIDKEMFKSVAAPIFQKAIDTSQEVLKRNNLPGEQLGYIDISWRTDTFPHFTEIADGTDPGSGYKYRSYDCSC